jgi:hypothetical protein
LFGGRQPDTEMTEQAQVVVETLAANMLARPAFALCTSALRNMGRCPLAWNSRPKTHATAA